MIKIHRDWGLTYFQMSEGKYVKIEAKREGRTERLGIISLEHKYCTLCGVNTVYLRLCFGHQMVYSHSPIYITMHPIHGFQVMKNDLPLQLMQNTESQQMGKIVHLKLSICKF